MAIFFTQPISFLITVFVIILMPAIVFAQPANDNCEGARVIVDIAEGCSDVGAFSNVGATPTNFTGNNCTSSNGRDVWFKITAIATDLTITVIGNTGFNSGGTLNRPEVELYIDNCTNFSSLECVSGSNTNVAELYQGGLLPGATYLIRVQGQNGAEGTFQICINNYFPPENPGSDLVTGAMLCDKSTFVVQSIDGTGDDPDEAVGTCLDIPGSGITSEQSSTWFTWIAENDGTLTFTLTPLNPGDDLDFVVYELPNGINNPNGKIPLRCMATACPGPTGLNDISTDQVEDLNCDPGEDGFLAPIDMEEGKAYGILVNNFTATGNGFSMEFGGTGNFQGPIPQIDAVINSTTNEICAGGEASFRGDNSSFVLGAITEYDWTFGVGAIPEKAIGPGPHDVTYLEPGEKSVVLTITTDLGCKVSDVAASVVIVNACCEDENRIDGDALLDNAVCGEANGAIDFSVNSNSPITFLEWDNGSTSEDLSDLSAGTYTVTITNLATCRDSFSFPIDSVAPFTVIPNITMPTCDGGRDGVIELNVTGGSLPIQFDFGNGLGSNNTLRDLPSGNYPVTIIDASGCSETSLIEVTELILELDPVVEAKTDPSCSGFSDGSIVVSIVNGLGPFQYNFNEGLGFQDENSLLNIDSGTYVVNVIDQNLCRGDFVFELDDPEPLSLLLDPTNVSCSGKADGQIVALVEGGDGIYSYSWSTNGQNEEISNLSPGTYSVTVLDSKRCQIEGTSSITQPPGITLSVSDVQDLTCFGDPTGRIILEGAGGNPNYSYSIDGIAFQPSPIFSDLAAGIYTLHVQDQRGCSTTVNAEIRQPEQLEVDAGLDLTVDLGYSTQLEAISRPFFRPVSYSWSPTEFLSCSDCANPMVFPNNSMSFSVTITDEDNCTATDSVTLVVFPNRPIYFPNAFSPDFDGQNDRFILYGGPAAEIIEEILIFDRWGTLVYEGRDVQLGQEQLGWDGQFNGQDAPSGVYAFIAKVRFIDGVSMDFEGDITLIR